MKFFPYLMAHYPTPQHFAEVLDLTAQYADTIEIGIPFSDPVADGPVIQRAAAEVLARGFRIESVFRALQGRARVPVAIMTYANPVLAYGRGEFLRACRECEVKFLIVPDVPMEESAGWRDEARQAGVSWISFVSLLTRADRLKRIASTAEGFIYLLSLTGITGASIHGVEAIRQKAMEIRQHTNVPIALGFGIKSAKDAEPFLDGIDAVIVGSKIIELLGAGDLKALENFYKEFTK